ncbi:MAG: exonuclease, partial [Rhodospirillaceae bacterium]|nr:exonuclease [Rhodospirillaceae bacterium]
ATLAAQPVIDTVLLAAHVFGADQPLTLDSLAERFGVTIEEADRHTALGDAVATADVLIGLFGMLDAAGVTTLRDAVEASELQAAIRRRQRAY